MNERSGGDPDDYVGAARWRMLALL